MNMLWRHDNDGFIYANRDCYKFEIVVGGE